jgi:hypothetical protein
MSGPGQVDFGNLWARTSAPKTDWPEALERERQFNLKMLSRAERERLAALAPETAYVMGVSK